MNKIIDIKVSFDDYKIIKSQFNKYSSNNKTKLKKIKTKDSIKYFDENNIIEYELYKTNYLIQITIKNYDLNKIEILNGLNDFINHSKKHCGLFILYTKLYYILKLDDI